MARLSILFQVAILVLQCVFQSCNPEKLQSFRRWDKENRFLKIELDEHKKAINLSFTGNETDWGTNFNFETVKGNLTIRPADNMTDYILAVEEGHLVVKYLPNVNLDTNTSKYSFSTRRIKFNYSGGNNTKMNESYVIIRSEAKPDSPRYIKSSRSGMVSLSVNWKNCGSWIEIV